MCDIQTMLKMSALDGSCTCLLLKIEGVIHFSKQTQLDFFIAMVWDFKVVKGKINLCLGLEEAYYKGKRKLNFNPQIWVKSHKLFWERNCCWHILCSLLFLPIWWWSLRGKLAKTGQEYVIVNKLQKIYTLRFIVFLFCRILQ